MVGEIQHLYGEKRGQWANLMKSNLTFSLNTNMQCIPEVKATLEYSAAQAIAPNRMKPQALITVGYQMALSLRVD